MEQMRYGKDNCRGMEIPIPTKEQFSITQEELDAKKEEFFAKGGRVKKLGFDFLNVRINPTNNKDTRDLIDSIRAEVDSDLSASRRHLRTSLYGD